MGCCRRVVFALAALLLGAAACKRDPDVIVDNTSSRSPVVQPSAKPVDHLAPGELLEGKETAFGLALPRETPVERTFVDVVYASGAVPTTSLVKYFRARVRDGVFRQGDYSATFERVKIPGNPGREFSIRMTQIAGRPTIVEVRDTTPPPVPDLPNETERWRQVGLTKDGKLLDPRHTE